MSFEFEPRPYGPDSTPEELAAIRARVRVVGDGIVEFHDLPVGSSFSLGVMTEEMERLTAGWPKIKVLVDLVGARPPNAEYRETLFAFHEREPRVTTAALFIGKSRVLRAIAKFALVVFRSQMRMDVFSDRGEAMRYLEHAD